MTKLTTGMKVGETTSNGWTKIFEFAGADENEHLMEIFLAPAPRAGENRPVVVDILGHQLVHTMPGTETGMDLDQLWMTLGDLMHASGQAQSVISKMVMDRQLRGQGS